MESAQTPGSDDELLRAARNGDRAALETLVSRYEPRVYRFGLSMCRDAADADDVLQDTFVSMVRALRTFRADSSLSTWLYTIARHACLKKRRRRAAAPRSVESLDALGPHVREGLASTSANPEQLAATNEIGSSLRAAIGALDAAQREVLVLRDVEGLTAADTAQVLGLTVAAVKSRLHRARIAVREALAPMLSPLPRPTGDGHWRDVLARFSEHLDGELSSTACAQMEAHLETCPACQWECATLKRALALCRDANDAVPPETQAAVRDAIRVCLGAQPRPSRARRPS